MNLVAYVAAELRGTGPSGGVERRFVIRLDVSLAGARHVTTSRRWTGHILIVLLAVGAAACSDDDTYLPALLADPMAEYSHPDLEVDFRTEIPRGEGRVGGFASLASVTTGFVLHGDADSVIADLLATAESAGWTVLSQEPAVGSDGTKGWSAEKELPEGVAGLGVNLSPPDSDEDWDLSIRLSFLEES